MGSTCDLTSDLSLHLHPYYGCASSQGSDETAHMSEPSQLAYVISRLLDPVTSALRVFTVLQKNVSVVS